MATQAISAPPRAATAVAAEVHPPKRRIKWGTIARHAVLLTFVAIVLLPIAWVVLLSFKSLPDSVQRYIWPKLFASPFWIHYKFAWRQVPDLTQIFTSSVEVTLGTIVCSTVASVLAGYALVHLRTPARRVVTSLLVASMFFPTRVTALVGIFQVQDRLHLINVTWGSFFRTRR